MTAEIARRARELSTAALLGIFLGAGLGCVRQVPLRSGVQLTEARVASIQRGKTTKYELLESLGMPVSIAKKGETLLIPRGAEFSAFSATDRVGAGVRGLRFESASAEAFFEPFSDRATGAQHRVYYYYYTTSGKRSSSAVVYTETTTETLSNELWALIDEQNGIVEDFLFRPGAVRKRK